MPEKGNEQIMLGMNDQPINLAKDIMKTVQLLFLAGAAGDPTFWQPVANLLPASYRCTLQAYPEFAGQPKVASVHSFATLSDWVIDHISQPTIIVAQSMGGIIAIQAALRKPNYVQGLVLVATSGGLDTSALGAADWREDYLLNLAHLPRWFVEAQYDLSPDLANIKQPVLLLWGDADPISPLAIGHALKQQLPHAHLHIIPQGQHDFAYQHAPQVAQHIRAFIESL